MCEIGTRKRPHFQQEGGPFFCRILHPPSFRADMDAVLRQEKFSALMILQEI